MTELDDSPTQKIGHLFLNLCFQCRRVAIWPDGKWLHPQQQRVAVITSSFRWQPYGFLVDTLVMAEQFCYLRERRPRLLLLHLAQLKDEQVGIVLVESLKLHN